ncbi:hypothetical protein ACIBSV_46760 [Embleya sp. NPDC050154]|uniref:hypothetical protein n=1 Tax=Embleya sp. NPDC050154 TaxID=3363988 RepID=UPI0037AF87E7
MANVKLRLLADYYRMLTDEGAHRTFNRGDEFETDGDNADRLIKAGAAEKASAPDTSKDGGDGDEKVEDPPPTDPPPTDPAGKPKPTPRGAK